jgi:hypothetical protein
MPRQQEAIRLTRYAQEQHNLQDTEAEPREIGVCSDHLNPRCTPQSWGDAEQGWTGRIADMIDA